MNLLKAKSYMILLFIINFSSHATYQANFDVIFDSNKYPPFIADDTHLQISKIKYSKGGDRIVFYGRYLNNEFNQFIDYKAYVIDFDGSNLREIPLPQRDDGFTGSLEPNSFAINDDGTLVYFGTYKKSQFLTGGNKSIPAKLYKVAIPNSVNPVSVSQISQVIDQEYKSVQTTSSGDWVYYYDTKESVGGDDFIYRVSSAGSVPQVIIQDTGLQLTVASSNCTGKGEHISDDFSISGDGSKVLFRISDIFNDNEYCAFNKAWWVLHSNLGDNLLNPANELGYEGGIVSSDGNKVVIADDYNYYSFDGDASNQRLIEPQSYNYQGPAINANGSKYFYRDNIHDTGALVNTNGSQTLDILPKGTYYTLYISLIAGLNHTGDRLAFLDNRGKIYAGRLQTGSNESLAPIIGEITFDPAYIIEGNTDPVRVNVTAQSVVGDIAVVKIDNIIDGHFIPFGTDSSHYFIRDPQDYAGNGIYTETSNRRNNGDFNNPTKITVRISVIDTIGNIRIVEKDLNIGVFTNGFE